MDKVYISNLKAQEQIKTIFLVKSKNIAVDKKGNSYITMTLADKTGNVDARYWGEVEKMSDAFNVDDFVLVKGFVQKFQNRNQVVVHAIEVVDSSQVQISDYLPISTKDKEKMMTQLLSIVDKIENPFVKKLVLSVLEDPKIEPLFKLSPAAKSVHHAYIGGLLEHTLSICEVMIFLASHYKILDLDLLIFGAIFHDIGKVWELSYETQITYTDVGRLVGHIQLGAELVEKKTSEISNFPVDLKNVCKHIVLSHHGLLEYGSPKRPKFLEAVIVGMIDDLDSKVNSIHGFMKSQQQTNDQKWTGFNEMYDRYFYLGTLSNNEPNKENI